eukprot:Seg1223.3 transcript_id=Seg1223.3/GoldUCD/mRNA.D3Y31 product="hypothetical protein" protein_id=Seg1223.3/GoldUCD/D3Y31
MPGTHPKRKKNDWQYTEENVKQALSDVKNGSSIRKACKENGLPKTTLIAIVKRGKISKNGKETVLTSREEERIAEWVKESARRGFGKTAEQVREGVKQVLDRAGRKVKIFNGNRPGRSWWFGFLRRHPDLHMLRPRPLELSRASACTREKVFGWFDSFESFLKEHNIASADQIYNCDESGFPLQACSSSKVCAEKVMKRAFHMSSSSKTSITTLQCISASGSVLPSAVYFPGKSLNPEYCLGFPSNVFIGFSDSGWMETYQFYAWVANHFVHQIPPRRPVVLLIDGHLSHVDYNTSLFCKHNQILLFRLPPHTSHVMQPADRGFFNVFKGEWKKACTKFSFENPGLVVAKRTFSRVFMEAYDKTARPDVIKSSFKCAGIWPVNRHAIDPSMFAPGKLFNETICAEETPTKANTTKESSTVEEVASDASELPGTSAPKEMEAAKKDNRHPILKTLEQLEENVGRARVNLFKIRLAEGYDVEDDALFIAWKALTLKKTSMEEAIGEASFLKSTLNEDLCPVIESVLKYPEVAKKEKKVRKKLDLPRHMTSEAALKVLEAQDLEKRRKELLKEAKRQKKENKGKENKSGAENVAEKKEAEKEKKKKNRKSTKKRKNESQQKNVKTTKYKKIHNEDENEVRVIISPHKTTKDDAVASPAEEVRARCGECYLAEGDEDDDENWVQCDSCGIWYHVSCTNLNYVLIGEIKFLDWLCINCE